jgi:hypothetical protein
METKNNQTEGDATLSASIEMEVEKAASAPTTTQKDSFEVEDTAQLQESVERLKLRDKRLSGAARKRLRWLLKQGIPEDQARSQAAKPIDPEGRGSKRAHSDGSTPEAATKKRPTPTGGVLPQDTSMAPKVTAPISFKQAVEGKKVGILHQGFPEDSLSNDQMKAIQEAILQKIVDLEEGSVKPKFLGSTYRAGWMVLNCENEATAKWLLDHVGTLSPWEGAKLKAVEKKDLPKAIIVNAFFPDSVEDNNERILKLLRGQNDGLSTAGWRILRRTQEGSAVHLTMSIDGPSCENLKKIGYKASFKFGQVGIRPKSAAKPPANPPTSNRKPKGTTVPVDKTGGSDQRRSAAGSASKQSTSKGAVGGRGSGKPTTGAKGAKAPPRVPPTSGQGSE